MLQYSNKIKSQFTHSGPSQCRQDTTFEVGNLTSFNLKIHGPELMKFL